MELVATYICQFRIFRRQKKEEWSRINRTAVKTDCRRGKRNIERE